MLKGLFGIFGRLWQTLTTLCRRLFRRPILQSRPPSEPRQPPAPPIPLPRGGPDYTIDELPITYTGLLDDVMMRYSTEVMTEDFFRKMIAKNVFFGGGILFNDGYLVNHPIARKYIREDGNILRTMLAANFVRILTRAGDADALTRMPEMMAASGNAAYDELVRGNEWGEYREVLRHIAANSFRTGNAVAWPRKDMSFGYVKLMARALREKDTPSHLGLTQVTREHLVRIEADFLGRAPQAGNPRDKIERAARTVLQATAPQPAEAMRQMMDIANQCYHYNFGLALTGSFKNNIAVDTTIGRAFDELLELDEVDAGHLDDIPILRVPNDVPFDDGALFLPFLDHSSRLGRSKIMYLKKLDELLRASDRNVADLKRDIDEATEEYGRRIAEHFERRFGRVTTERMMGDPISLGVGRVRPGQAGEVKAVAGPTAGIAIRVLDQSMGRGKEFLLRRFKVIDDTNRFDPTHEQLIRIGDIRPQIASLAFNRKEAEAFLSDVPDFTGSSSNG